MVIESISVGKYKYVSSPSSEGVNASIRETDLILSAKRVDFFSDEVSLSSQVLFLKKFEFPRWSLNLELGFSTQKVRAARHTLS